MTEPSRLEAIEIKLSHLESSLQHLGLVVMRQQRELELLAAHNRALKDQIEAMADGGADAAGGAGGFEKPPHY